ncbi:hypothetical protein [Methylobacterium pseudosasicola]|uniref:Uncharacterized protein n=1 Tax=Methylobacterium pseudosasicola TaxID=582667 RepID=A0A1I4S2R6_9HYPH|nr:hypothetical protein [Methylobacterium pseudosasicola]SFM58584.1 hypothetical protein SAMN05192568_103935 [Methylobacterium pseudosasicola]
MPATQPTRPRALALGVILPLAFVGAASAQQGASAQSSWVDPPARASTAAPAKEPMKAATQEQPKPPADAKAPVRQAAKPDPAEDALPKSASTRAAAPKRAAALERPPVRETLRRHAAHPRRLADTPAAVAPAPAPVSAERAAIARALAANYLATVSSTGDTMVGTAPHFYATRVRFYGHPITLAGLLAEKRSFVQRWPERRYEPRAIQTACDSETCTIRTIVDFRTANPGRGAISTGAAELVLEVSFAGPRPVIVGETGRVLRRSVQAGTLAPSPGKA